MNVYIASVRDSDMNANRDLPFISVIMPVRNERAAIEKCVEGFLGQTYPRSRFELIIADHSTDGTREILEQFSKKLPGWLRLCENPSGRIADGYNIALEHARGEIVANYVGHAYPEEHYLEHVVAAMEEDSADMIGGRIIPVPASGSQTSKAIALALTSALVVGPNAFTRTTKCSVLSTHWMAVRRTLANLVGPFNAYLERGEDCDWYERMIAAGGKAIFRPDIVSYYFPRSTFAKLLSIQVLNAWHRARLFVLTKRGMRLHHLLPLFAIVLWCIVSAFLQPTLQVVLVPLWVYLVLAISISVRISRPSYALIPGVLTAMVTIQIGHVMGLVGGLIVNGWRAAVMRRTYVPPLVGTLERRVPL